MESKSKNLEMLRIEDSALETRDSGEKLNQKIRYGKICRKRVLVGLRWGLLWFVIGDVVGYWLCLGFNRVYLGTRD